MATCQQCTLSRQGVWPSTAPVSHSADDFQRFFVTKVETVRAATAESSGAVSVNRRRQR